MIKQFEIQNLEEKKLSTRINLKTRMQIFKMFYKTIVLRDIFHCNSKEHFTFMCVLLDDWYGIYLKMIWSDNLSLFNFEI